MPSSYSTNLKIELQATGENSGTWGTVTNTNLGTALEQAIVGYGNPDYLSDANLTLTYTDTNSAQTARALVLNVTSALSLTGTRELVVPTIQKQYIVQNNTTGSQSITVKTSAGTGITIPNGRKAHLYVDGTNVIYMDDYVDINGGAIDGTPVGANSASTGAFSTLSATGNVNFDGGTFTFNDSGADKDFRVEGDTDANLLFSDASTDRIGIGTNTPASKLDVNGTITATAVNTTTLDLTNLEVTNIKAKDGTSAASIADSTGVVSFTANPILSGGTANGVLYLNGSKVATSGSALTFNGTDFLNTASAAGSLREIAVENSSTSASSNARMRVRAGNSTTTTTGDAYIQFTDNNNFNWSIGSGSTSSRDLVFTNHFTIGTSEYMRLTSSGNLGIGTSSPSSFDSAWQRLVIGTGSGDAGQAIYSGSASIGSIAFADGTTGAQQYAGLIRYLHASDAMTFWTGATERATISASGNLGLGVTPSAWGSGLKALQVGANSYASLFDFNNGVSALSSNLFWTGSAYSRISASSRWSFAYFQDTTNGAHSWLTSTAAGTSTPTMSTLMTLDASGNLIVGNTTANGKLDVYKGVSYNADAALYSAIGINDGAVNNNKVYYWRTGLTGNADGQDYVFQTLARTESSWADRARITSGGNFLVGTTSGTATITANASGGATIRALRESVSATNHIQMEHDGTDGKIAVSGANALIFATNSTNQARITSGGVFSFADVTGLKIQFNGTGANFYGISKLAGGGNLGDGEYKFTAGDTSGGGFTFSSSGIERARITSGGLFLVNAITSSGFGDGHRIFRDVAENTTVLSVDGGTEFSAQFRDVASGGYSTAGTAIIVGKNSSTSRSINAGGTVNASGADYAEYMEKAGEFFIAKGDVCGIDANGKLTNVYANAVAFVVKSTNPSYVGGDSWGAGYKDDPEGLEAARQKVDRIAFSGQVPVNVLGATPGQYIVPVNDNGAIKGVAVSNPSFEQYQMAIGKVIAIEDDGRARIIVKIA
jgi:hypothetical protein